MIAMEPTLTPATSFPAEPTGLAELARSDGPFAGPARILGAGGG
jgi:hypothetical protein